MGISIAEKYTRLKTAIGGNREHQGYEETFGMPREEQNYITPPSRVQTRILSELLFAQKLSAANKGAFDKELHEALDFLLEKQREQSTITTADSEKAEEILSPLEAASKEYEQILAAHSHIDMNWMWSYDETVAIVLATFRSILNIMDQYPEFHFSQSQAAVYKIVEEYDPELMEEIKARIAEGRWEVTASAWVETDKNMPSTESLLRHIEYTKEYLSTVWGVKDFDLDFSPDTFGHSANVPEINSFGEVKYYYHCRGNGGKEILYRYKGISGKEVLAYREPNWYNGAITPHMGSGLIDISKKCYGLKTGLVVYGVGDHGGGPTRRDVERALDMMTWKIYPRIRFGTIRDYFHEAEKIREKLPVVDHELNFFAPGCYTTQSRIKRGNKKMEDAFYDAEALGALAGARAGFILNKKQLTTAWQNVLFTHFHDILTGSCVQDTREHAMGLFQSAKAASNTQIQNAMRSIGMKIDTSSIPVDIDAYNSQSEGAGAGYGIESFVGVPSTERGSGRTRIFHIYNTLPVKRQEVVELTVWDWTGDLRRLRMRDYEGNEIESQLLDSAYQQYWDHKYVRVLADVSVPALGYTTIVLYEKEQEDYPVYLQGAEHVAGFYDDMKLCNDKICVTVDRNSGRISSLTDKEGKKEIIQSKNSAGLTYLETERRTSSAWNVGRDIKEIPADRCVHLEKITQGSLRSSIKAVYEIASSKAEVIYTLDRHQDAVKMEIKVDWHEIGADIIPVLDYRIPLSYTTEQFRYDVPAGSLVRPAYNNDVPGLKYGMAVRDEGSAYLVSDCKYGYRGYGDALGLKLINSSVSPDPYPERGIHNITLWLGIGENQAAKMEERAYSLCHGLLYQPSNCHKGTLAMEDSLLETKTQNAVITSVQPIESGVLVRGYESEGQSAKFILDVKAELKEAKSVNLFGASAGTSAKLKDGAVELDLEPNAIFELRITNK